MAALSVQSGEGRERGVGQGVAQLGVRRDAADDRDPCRDPSSSACRRRCTRARTIACWYEAARSALRAPSRPGRGRGPHRATRSSSPENEKSRPGTRATGKSNAVRVAFLREPIDGRAAGIAEPEQPGALVEGLTRGVVQRRAEPFRAPALAHGEEQRVAAAREQARERRLQRVGLEVERCDVALEVVDRDERQPGAPTRSPWPRRCRRAALRRGPGPWVTATRSTLAIGPPADSSAVRTTGDDELEVAPRRDLGHDAAEAGVQVGLRRRRRTSARCRRRSRRRGGLVARRLDPEDHDALARTRVGSRHMISASSRLSV